MVVTALLCGRSCRNSVEVAPGETVLVETAYSGQVDVTAPKEHTRGLAARARRLPLHKCKHCKAFRTGSEKRGGSLKESTGPEPGLSKRPGVNSTATCPRRGLSAWPRHPYFGKTPILMPWTPRIKASRDQWSCGHSGTRARSKHPTCNIVCCGSAMCGLGKAWWNASKK